MGAILLVNEALRVGRDRQREGRSEMTHVYPPIHIRVIHWVWTCQMSCFGHHQHHQLIIFVLSKVQDALHTIP